MLNPLALMKASKNGGLGPEQLAEMLSAVGIKVELSPVEEPHVPGAFQGLAKSSLHPGSKVFVVRGFMKDGSKLEAIFVMSPAQVLSLVPTPRKG